MNVSVIRFRHEVNIVSDFPELKKGLKLTSSNWWINFTHSNWMYWTGSQGISIHCLFYIYLHNYTMAATRSILEQHSIDFFSWTKIFDDTISAKIVSILYIGSVLNVNYLSLVALCKWGQQMIARRLIYSMFILYMSKIIYIVTLDSPVIVHTCRERKPDSREWRA